MTKNKCLLCGSIEFDELLHLEKLPIFFGAVPIEKKEMVESFPLTIAICESCSLIQQINLLEQDILKKVYIEDYYNCPSPVASGMGTGEIDKFYSFFERCKIEKGSLLEIGCFDGYLLGKLRNSGWDVYGCDPSSITSTVINNFGKEKIVNDFFTEKTFPSAKFDVIIFRNLLEHLYNIHDFIINVTNCLKPGGRIFIDVPNIRALLNLGGLGTFFHQHVSYFSLQTIAKLLVKYNYNIEESQEGNPNLFVCGVRKINESIVNDTTDHSFNLKREKENFLRETSKVEMRIKDIFDNPAYQDIAIFGASITSTRIVNLLEKRLVNKIRYIVDNDKLKHGKVIYGCNVPISSPSILNDSKFDVILISTYLFEKEIHRQLVEAGVAENKILTLR